MTGTPQGGIASPILFNIYMQHFDEGIKLLVDKFISDKNIEQNRTLGNRAVSRRWGRAHNRVNTIKKGIRRLIIREEGNKKIYSDFTKFKIKRKQLRQSLSLQRTIPYVSHARTLLRYSYTRYADDWIILTNANIEIATQIKELISIWIKKELKLELSLEKTLITDLNTNRARFLGFTLYIPPFRKVVSQFNKLLQKDVKKSRNVGPYIGLDHDRIRKRLITEGFINEKLKPTHAKKFLNLKPIEIVQKFDQKIRGLHNYYYHNITCKSDALSGLNC